MQHYIEVCERLHDWWYDYSSGYGVQRPKYHACLDGNEGRWACGVSPNDAIDNLVRNCEHLDLTTMKIYYLYGKLAR
jgi:hypothetical protein